jgi:hypothetical protein
VAKKVKKDGERKEEKRAVFEPPEFDERAYLVEEIGKMKVSLVFTFIAIPFGAIGAYLGDMTGSGWPGLVAALAGVPLGYLVMKGLFGVDMLAGKKRDIVMVAGLFLISWLVFAILFSNPPFVDNTEPSITDVRVYAERPSDPASGWSLYMLMGFDKDQADAKLIKNGGLPKGFSVREGDNLTILVRAGDAQGIESVRGTWWTITPSENYTVMPSVNESQWRELGSRPTGIAGEHYYELFIPNVTVGNVYFKLVVEAVNGKTKTFTTEYIDSVPVL